jgi:hypothetical protein
VSPGGGQGDEDQRLASFARLVRAYNEQGKTGWAANTTDDVVMVTAAEWPGGGIFRGREECERFLAQFEEAWARIRLEYSDPEVIEGRIFAPSRWVTEGHASGIESTVDFFSVTTLRGDRACRFDAFFRRSLALEFARTGQRSDWPAATSS